MRTINKILQERLVAQAEEADLQNMTKIAEIITTQLEKTPVRDSEENYVYAAQDFEFDIESSVWNIIIRACDFHSVSIDPVEAQKIVEHHVDAIISDFRKVANVKHGVGAYEPKVPGELREKIVTEVSE